MMLISSTPTSSITCNFYLLPPPRRLKTAEDGTFRRRRFAARQESFESRRFEVKGGVPWARFHVSSPATLTGGAVFPCRPEKAMGPRGARPEHRAVCDLWLGVRLATAAGPSSSTRSARVRAQAPTAAPPNQEDGFVCRLRRPSWSPSAQTLCPRTDVVIRKNQERSWGGHVILHSEGGERYVQPAFWAGGRNYRPTYFNARVVAFVASGRLAATCLTAECDVVEGRLCGRNSWRALGACFAK